MRAALAAAQPAGPSATEAVSVDWEFAKAYRPDQPDNIEVDDHFYVANGWYKSGWADAMKHVAAQPKAPSPSESPVWPGDLGSPRSSRFFEDSPLRAALPAQGWSYEQPTKPGYYPCLDVDLLDSPFVEPVYNCTGGGLYIGDHEYLEDCKGEYLWGPRLPDTPASVPTPPSAEPGERSGK